MAGSLIFVAILAAFLYGAWRLSKSNTGCFVGLVLLSLFALLIIFVLNLQLTFG